MEIVVLAAGEGGIVTAKPFEQGYFAGWEHMDFNGHMRNSAYLDLCSDTRLKFFEANGFTADKFARLGFGPVIMTDEIRYFRELNLLERFSVTLAMAGLAPNASRFKLRNEFFREDGELACRVTSVGGWLDLKARKLIAPPPEIVAAYQAATKTDDFVELKASAG